MPSSPVYTPYWKRGITTAYRIWLQLSTGYLLNDATGQFAAAPADPYVGISEHSVIKGLYGGVENRDPASWTTGFYLFSDYEKVGGSEAPLTDPQMGYGCIEVKDNVIVGTHSNPNLAEIEASSVLAKAAALTTLTNHIILASGTINDLNPSKTKIVTTLTGYGDTFWDNMGLKFSTGPNTGPVRAIKAYKTDGEITLNTPTTFTPTNGDAFDIIFLRAFRLAGLSAQEIADALQLAPVGVAADGSVGEQLAQIVGFLEGEGNRSVTIQLYITATTTPIADATITVMNSLDNLFLTQKTTDANGRIVMARSDGTYKLRLSKAGYTFTTPETLTVSGSATHTFYGTGISIPVPAAGLQTLYGNIRRLNWALPAGEKVYATIIGQQHPNDALVQDYKLEATIDAAGQFSLTVPQAATIRFEADRYGFHEITTTTDATKDIVDYL